jgi:hypothetical protein
VFCFFLLYYTAVKIVKKNILLSSSTRDVAPVKKRIKHAARGNFLPRERLGRFLAPIGEACEPFCPAHQCCGVVLDQEDSYITHAGLLLEKASPLLGNRVGFLKCRLVFWKIQSAFLESWLDF